MTKDLRVNNGEVTQYFVQNSHPAIVTPEVYDHVQQEFKKRKAAIGYMTGGSCFSGKIVCGECSSFYGSKVWHSTSKYRRVIWQCNHKFEEKCKTPHFYEDNIKEAFNKVFNNIIENKVEILQNYEVIIQTLTDTSGLDADNTELKGEIDLVADTMRKCIEENAHTTIDQVEYLQRYSSLVERYGILKKRLVKNIEKLSERVTRRGAISTFIKTLESYN